MILVGVQMFTVGLIGEMIVVPRMQKETAYDVVEILELTAPVEA